jgi:hypothetical protein
MYDMNSIRYAAIVALANDESYRCDVHQQGGRMAVKLAG